MSRFQGTVFVVVIFAFSVIATANGTSSRADEDLVLNLPGVDKPSWRLWSGYITVENSSSVPAVPPRHLHYLMAEAQSNPEDAPVVLWLNGGPGCSSLMGFFTEHGPFLAPETTSDHKLRINRYSWNTVATMIYVEAPAPVGFSYGGNGTSGDDLNSGDNFLFLQGLFQRFPELRTRDLYLTGESYAGQYIPQLAKRVFDYNNELENESDSDGRTSESPSIASHGFRFKGYMVGNPSGLSSSAWEYGYYEFMVRHGLLSEIEADAVAVACNKTEFHASDDCATIQQETWKRNFMGIDPYNILAPCVGDGPGDVPGCFTSRMLGREAIRDDEIQTPPVLTRRRRDHDTNSMRAENMHGVSQTFVPCGDYNTTVNYLNSAAVKTALHIPAEAYDWTPCSEHLTYSQYTPGTPDIYRALSPHVSIFVYSGDLDTCVPFTGTRAGVENLGLDLQEPYRPWFDIDPNTNSSQIAGYTIGYDGVRYVTVRGSGHMVPTDRPAQALSLFKAFATGAPLSSVP